MTTIVRRWSILRKRLAALWWVGSEESVYTGVILKASVLKDLARTATFVVKVRMRCALDPSQAQDDAIMGE